MANKATPDYESEARKTALTKLKAALEANRSRLTKSLQALSCVNNLNLEDMSEGNLNYVIKISVTNLPSVAAVIKQAPPYIKCLGPDYPLHCQRGQLEYNALCQYSNAVKDSVPQPYFYDEKNNVLCLEYLEGYSVFRSELVKGHLHEAACQKLASNLGKIHLQNHVGIVGADTIKQLDEHFQNPELVSLTQQFFFTKVYIKDDPTNWCLPGVQSQRNSVLEDEETKSAAAAMLDIFLHKKESLIHGDLHTGSVMVRDDDAKMIDLEFAYVGPCAFDVGSLIANYIFSYYQHMSTEENNDAHRLLAYRLIDICHQTVNTYLKEMTAHIGNRNAYVENFMNEVAGFAGCEIIRRILGKAHVADMEQNEYAAVDCLGAGVRLLKAYKRIHSIGFLMVIALMLIY